jgi:PPP family 3-phenylpropionic acid transporter
MSTYIFFKLSALYFVYFALLGAMAPYLSLYLESEGFSLLEIGQLVSLLMVTKMVAPLIWGSLADKYNKSLLLVRVGALMTLVCYLGFFWAHTFWSFAVVIVLYSFFWNAVLPQIEVLTLYNLAEQKNRYSRIRLWGSIGFIISVALCGWLFDRQELTVFPWVLLFLISAIVIVSFMGFSEVQLTKTQTKFGKAFKFQLLRPWVLLFFSANFLLHLSHGAYYTYFSIYLSSLGYSKVQIGGLWALGVIAEVMMFVVMHRWLKRSPIENIMLLSLLFTVIRWMMTAVYADSFMIIALVQCLHAFSFGAMHVASIQFVHHNFEQQSQGRAQALYSSMGFGAGGAVGAYLSGYMVSSHSYSNAFLVSAIICSIGFGLVLLMKCRFKN